MSKFETPGSMLAWEVKGGDSKCIKRDEKHKIYQNLVKGDPHTVNRNKGALNK